MKILPFAGYSEPTASYPEALEATVTLLTVESRRSKGTGLALLRRATEEVAWVSRFVWPLVALPVNLPVVPGPGGEQAQDDGASAAPKALVFDLTAMLGSSLPEFQAREGADPGELQAGGRMELRDFTTMLQARRDALKQTKKPLAGAFNAVRGAVRGFVKRGQGGTEEIGGFLAGQQQLCKDLLAHAAQPEAPDWEGVELPRAMAMADAEAVAAEMADRMRAYIAQAQRVEETAAEVERMAAVYPPEIDAERERISTSYNDQIDRLRPEVDSAISELQRNLEDRLNAVHNQFSATVSAQEAELSRAENDVQRYRGMGKEFEAQSADARRAKQDAQRRFDATKREADGAQKEARDHFRKLIDQENEKLSTMIKQRDVELAQVKEIEDKLNNTLRELTAAAASAAAQDRKAATDLGALALDWPTIDGDYGQPMELGLPFYVARLDGPKTRFIPLLPVTLKRSRSVTQMVTGLIGTVALPSDPHSARYESVMGRALTSALEGGSSADEADTAVAAVIGEQASSSNVLMQPTYRELAFEGLESLRTGGWMRDKQAEEQRQALVRMLG